MLVNNGGGRYIRLRGEGEGALKARIIKFMTSKRAFVYFCGLVYFTIQ